MGKTAEVERNGVKQSLSFPENLIGTLIESKKKGGSMMLIPRMPAIIGSFDGMNEKSPGKDAGILEGDIVLSINNLPVNFFDEMRPILQNSTGNTVD